MTARPPSRGWTADEIRRVGYRTADIIAEYLSQLEQQPVFQPFPAAQAGAMVAEAMPQLGATADAVLDQFVAQISPYPFGNGHPRFYGW